MGRIVRLKPELWLLLVCGLLVCGLHIGGLLVGCTNSEDLEPPERRLSLPFDGQRVGLAFPKGFDIHTQWDGPLYEWSAQTGAEFELSEYDAADAEKVTKRFSPASTETLVTFPLTALGDLLAEQALAPLSPDLQSPDNVNWPDLLSGLRDHLASPGRRPSLVPVSCPVLVCYYRQDLVSLSKLSPPETWEDYQTLLTTLADWAPGLTAVEPWGPDFRGTMFFARAVSTAKHPGNYSVFFDMETGAPRISGPGFVRALTMAQKGWPALAPDYGELTPAECRQRILSGEAALAISLEPPRTSESEVDAVTRRDDIRIGVCRLPGSRDSYNPSRQAWELSSDPGGNHVTLVGFAGWAVGASASRDEGEIQAAWHAVSHLGSRGFSSGFPPAALSICRETQLADILGALGSGLEGGEAGMYLDAVAHSLRDSQIVVDLPVPRRNEFRAALDEALAKVMAGTATPEAALEEASTKWQTIVDEIGAERLKRIYRAGLGLGVASGP